MRHPASAHLLHREFLDRAVPLLAADRRVVGVAASGSYAKDAMDAWSDVDLVLACDPADHMGLMADREAIAATLGPLVAAFTGEHVGEPRLMICLYGPPALHVDVKVLALGDLATRVDEPVVLWDRQGRMREALAAGQGAWPQPDAQWIEDRFWVWVHYGALKIARGELQEAFDFLSYLRVTVLGPLGLARHGADPAGVRRVEAHPALASQLAATVGALDRRSLTNALVNAVTAYRQLRSPSIQPKLDAERVAMEFLREVTRDFIDQNSSSPDVESPRRCASLWRAARALGQAPVAAQPPKPAGASRPDRSTGTATPVAFAPTCRQQPAAFSKPPCTK